MTSSKQTKQTIFISYSWKDEAVCTKIDSDLRRLGYITTLDRHEDAVPFKSKLKEFMDSISLHDYTIVLVSDNYLKSYNCLYEVGKVMDSTDFQKKALQIILPSAKVFGRTGKYEYFTHWDNEISILTEKLKNSLSPETISLITEDLKEVKKIKENLPRFIEFLNSEKGLTLSEIENSNYHDLLNYISKNDIQSKKNETRFAFSKKNNILLPLEDFRHYVNQEFRGVIKGLLNYGIFIRIYMNNGYREGLLHRKKIEEKYNYYRVKSLLTYGLEINIKLIDLNYDSKHAENEGGLVLDISDDIQELIEYRLNVELINQIKSGGPSTYNIDGLNLTSIPIKLFELKNIEILDVSNNDISEIEIKKLFTRYLPKLKCVFNNDYVYVNDEENESTVKIKYK